MSPIESLGGMHSAMPEKTSSVGSVSRSAPRRSEKYEISMRGSLKEAKSGVLEACLEQAMKADFLVRRVRLHLPGGVQDKIDTGGPERKAYFIGICNELTLDLHPLLVCYQNDVLYSAAFEESLCLGNGEP